MSDEVRCQRCGAPLPTLHDGQCGVWITTRERQTYAPFCATHAEEAQRLVGYYVEHRISVLHGDRVTMPLGPGFRVPSPPESAPRTWRFTLPNHPLSPNRAAASSLRERMRDKRAWREGVAWAARQAYSGPPLQRARVTFTLIRPDSQWYDPDGAMGVCKRALDGLCVNHGGTFLIDDTAEHVAVRVVQKHGPRRCVEITIQEVVA